MDLDVKQVRVALLGSSCAGKSCIVRRFINNSFQGQYAATPGVDFHSRRMLLKPMGTITFIILDFGSTTINSKMLRIYLHGVDVFLLTYDMTNGASLTELRTWIDLLTVGEMAKSEASLGLIGTKGDLEHLRTVRLDAHTRFAQEFKIPLSFLVSSKTSESVMTCFSKSAIYHLSPDAKQKIRDHAIIQNTFSMKRASVASTATSATAPPQNNPTVSGKSGQPNQVAARSQSHTTFPDPSSVVCTLQ